MKLASGESGPGIVEPKLDAAKTGLRIDDSKPAKTETKPQVRDSRFPIGQSKPLFGGMGLEIVRIWQKITSRN